MPFTIQDYISRYLDKLHGDPPRPWYDYEVSAIEGMPAGVVGDMRSFCQTQYAKGVKDPDAIVKAWNEAHVPVPKAPVITINPISDRTPIGNVPAGDYWIRFRQEVKQLLAQQKS